MTRKEQIKQGIIEHYGGLGYQSGMIRETFETAVKWADEHPKEGLVDINKAREWVKNVFIGPFGEGLANSIADEFVKEMEE